MAFGARANEVPLDAPVSTAILEGSAKLKIPGKSRERRPMYRRLNYCAVRGFAPLCMDVRDDYTLECSFKKRLLRDIPEPEPYALEHFGRFVGRWLVANVPKATLMSFDDWIATAPYTQEKKNEFVSVHESLRGGRPTLKQCQDVLAFGKTESYPSWKHARMINSRSNFFKVWSGPLFKSIENVVYSLPWFIKHVPVADRARHVVSIKKANCFYYCTDYTAFESHFTPEFLTVCECQLYQWCLDYSSDSKFLCSVIAGKNKMHTRTGVKATVYGRRMSGDMCTSLGNGFTNLMLMLYAVYCNCGTCEGFVEGDDGIFASTTIVDASDFQRLGFSIKIERVLDPCRSAFCGLVFAESGQIVRNPFKFLQTFGWTSSFLKGKRSLMDQLLRAKALSAIYECPQCPVVGAVARFALARTVGVVPRFVDDGYHVPHDATSIPDFHPSPDTRVLFEDLYGISVALQEILEAHIFNGDFEFVALHIQNISGSSSFNSVLNHDVIGYCDRYLSVV